MTAMTPIRIAGLDEPYAEVALARIRAFLQATALRWWEQIGQHKPDSLFGHPQISDREAEAALRLPFLGRDADWPWSDEARDQLQKGKALDNKLQARRAAHPASPLARIEAAFGLDAAARDVLLLAILPELGTRYRRLLGYLMDDLSETAPSLEFLHDVLAPVHGEGLAPALVGGPLVKWRAPVSGTSESPSGQQVLAPEPGLISWLTQGGPTHAGTTGITSVATPEQGLSPEEIPRPLREALAALARGRCRSLVLEGEGGDDPELARKLAKVLEAPVAALDSGCVRDRECRRGLAIHCRLAGLIPLLDLTDIISEGLTRDDFAVFDRQILLCRHPRPDLGPMLLQPTLAVPLPPPSYADRIALWRRLLNHGPGGDHPQGTGNTAAVLADRFRLSAGAMHRAHARAALTAEVAGLPLRLQDLAAACRAEATPLLGGLAKRIAPDGATSLDDLVVPPITRRRLDDLIMRLDGRRRLASLAPGDAGLLMSSGTVALFAGAAGTGKTLAAVLVARALGSDLFKADLSALVSKWVGETEKHLDRLFREAELANAVLFFDEADALFGRRGEIRDARDRWANLEVNYLLQRIEEFDGGVILATNLKANIDEAFFRRIETVIEFPMPDAAARARILETLMPRSFERPDQQELRDLAAHLSLAGGNLKNIVVHASFRALAAAPDGATPRIARDDLLEGAAREYEKLGRPVTAQAFGSELYRELRNAMRVA
jgi:hypothetical protein